MDNNLQLEDKIEKYTIHIDSLNCNLDNNNTEIYIDLDDDIKNCIYIKTLKSEIYISNNYTYKSEFDDKTIEILQTGDVVYFDLNNMDRIILKERKYVFSKVNNLSMYGLEWERIYENPMVNNDEGVQVLKYDVYTKSASDIIGDSLITALDSNDKWLENSILKIEESKVFNKIEKENDRSIYIDHLKSLLLEDESQNLKQRLLRKNIDSRIYYRPVLREYKNYNVVGSLWYKSNNEGDGKLITNVKLIQNLYPGLNWKKIIDIDEKFRKDLDIENWGRITDPLLNHYLADYDILNFNFGNDEVNRNSNDEIKDVFIKHSLSSVDFFVWEKKTNIDNISSVVINSASFINELKNVYVKDPENDKIILDLNNINNQKNYLYSHWFLINEYVIIDDKYYFPKVKVSKNIDINNINNIEWDWNHDTYTPDNTKIKSAIESNNVWINVNGSYYFANSKTSSNKLKLNELINTSEFKLHHKSYIQLNKTIFYLPEPKHNFTEDELISFGLKDNLNKNDYVKIDNIYYIASYQNFGNFSYIRNEDDTSEEIHKIKMNTDIFANIDKNLGNKVLHNNNTNDGRYNGKYYNYNKTIMKNSFLSQKKYYDKIEIVNPIFSNDLYKIYKNELTGTSCGPNDTNTFILNPIMPELKRFSIKLYRINEFGEHELIQINENGIFRFKLEFTICYRRKKITRV